MTEVLNRLIQLIKKTLSLRYLSNRTKQLQRQLLTLCIMIHDLSDE